MNTNIAALVALVAFGASAACASEAAVAQNDPPGTQVAVVAGGCFWCIESDLEKLDGVLSVTSGYTGGPEKGPTYEQVSDHKTGHTEAVRVVFDPKKVSYEKVIEFFFRHIDPTQANGQFCDHGPQYRTGVFFLDAAQKAAAEKVKASMATLLKAPVVTEITAAGPFWIAEGYHQDFYKKSPDRYQSYRRGCGRDARVQQLFGAVGH